MSFVVSSFSLKITSIFNLKCSFDPIFQEYHFETCHKVEIPSALNTQTKKCLAAALAAKVYMLGGVWA